MERYTEILKLKEMLEKANIPFTFTDDLFGAKKKGEVDSKKYPAYQIRLNKDIDVVQHCYSYGEEKNLLEIMGGLTEEERETDGVLGNLTAGEVFKRFKYCYENGTAVYKVEKPETKTEQEAIKEIAQFMQNGEIDREKGYIDCSEFNYEVVTKLGIQRLAGAKALYNAGYRKASVVVDESVKRLKEKESPNLLAWEYGEGYLDCIKTAEQLADEMQKEVKNG